MRVLARVLQSVVFVILTLSMACGGGGGSTPPPPTVLPPNGLTYSVNSAVYTVGVAVTSNTPSSSGGAITSYSVSPILPAGLSLNTSTGVISGTPTAVTTTGSYTVTGSNSAGSTPATLTITVAAGIPTGIFTDTSSMSTTRSYHSASLLQNGRVLVAGGQNGTDLASADLYDPASKTFTATGAMTVPRWYHTSTLLPNGKVLITGGNNFSAYPTSALVSAELYDPSTGTFTSTGSMTSPRWHHTATLLANGKVLIVGGDIGLSVPNITFLSSAELYDPATGVFTSTGPMSTTRFCHTATLLPNGKVLVVGGQVGTGSSGLSAEVYDPVTGLFTATGPTTSGRCFHTATLLSNGKVLIAGGISTSGPADIYDPASGTFTPTTSMITAGRYYHAATLLENGEVLITGGWIGSGKALTTTELFNPVTGTFTATGSMNSARLVHTAVLLPNGKVIVAGGMDNISSIWATAEEYQ